MDIYGTQHKPKHYSKHTSTGHEFNIAGTMTGRASSGKSMFTMLKVRLPADFTKTVETMNSRAGWPQYSIKSVGTTYVFDNSHRSGDAFCTDDLKEMRDYLAERLSNTTCDPFNL